jgi:hypothetical protein
LLAFTITMNRIRFAPLVFSLGRLPWSAPRRLYRKDAWRFMDPTCRRKLFSK